MPEKTALVKRRRAFGIGIGHCACLSSSWNGPSRRAGSARMRSSWCVRLRSTGSFSSRSRISFTRDCL
eukprot:6073356-Prymnesium_polylepis.1